MVAFIEDSITEEELCSEPSQKLLINDRWPFRILLSLEIPFDFVKPGFSATSSVSISQQCAGSSNLSMVIWGASLSHLTLNIEDMVATASANWFSSRGKCSKVTSSKCGSNASTCSLYGMRFVCFASHSPLSDLSLRRNPQKNLRTWSWDRQRL